MEARGFQNFGPHGRRVQLHGRERVFTRKQLSRQLSRRTWRRRLLVLTVAAGAALAAWVSYRALMGWPVPGTSLLQRLGG